MTVKQWGFTALKYALMLCGLLFLGQLIAPYLKFSGNAGDQPQWGERQEGDCGDIERARVLVQAPRFHVKERREWGRPAVVAEHR